MGDRDENTVPTDIRDRATAYGALMTHGSGTRLDEALSEKLASYPADAPGRNLVTELVYGVVRQRARLDHHLLFFCPGGSCPCLPVSA